MDLTKEPIGYDKKNKPVYLNEIWPSPKEIADTVRKSLTPAMFRTRYADVFTGGAEWKKIKVDKGKTYHWDIGSTYVKNPPYFEGMTDRARAHRRHQGRAHPAASSATASPPTTSARRLDQEGLRPAGKYLMEHGVQPADFNSYGARRGNHEVMMRGTFANIRIRNEMLGGKEGGNTLYYASPTPRAKPMSIYRRGHEISSRTVHATVMFAGKEYGTGSSRD